MRLHIYVACGEQDQQQAGLHDDTLRAVLTQRRPLQYKLGLEPVCLVFTAVHRNPHDLPPDLPPSGTPQPAASSEGCYLLFPGQTYSSWIVTVLSLGFVMCKQS